MFAQISFVIEKGGKKITYKLICDRLVWFYRDTKHLSVCVGTWPLVKYWPAAGTWTRLEDVREIKKLLALVLKVFGS